MPRGVVMDSSREATHSPGSLHLCQMSLAAGVLRVQGVSAHATLCPDLWRHLHLQECKAMCVLRPVAISPCLGAEVRAPRLIRSSLLPRIPWYSAM